MLIVQVFLVQNRFNLGVRTGRGRRCAGHALPGDGKRVSIRARIYVARRRWSPPQTSLDVSGEKFLECDALVDGAGFDLFKQGIRQIQGGFHAHRLMRKCGNVKKFIQLGDGLVSNYQIWRCLSRWARVPKNEVGEMDHRGKTRRIRAVFGTVESTG